MQSVHVAMAQSLRVVGRRGLQDSEDACPIVTMGSPSLSDDAFSLHLLACLPNEERRPQVAAVPEQAL